MKVTRVTKTVIGVSVALCVDVARRDFANEVLMTMNQGAVPCADFYNYAWGSWLNRTVIPEDEISFSRPFTGIADSNNVKLRAILENNLKNASHPNAIAGHFFNSRVKYFATGLLNVAVLTRYQSVSGAFKNSETLAVALGFLHQFMAVPFYRTAIAPCERTLQICYLCRTKRAWFGSAHSLHQPHYQLPSFASCLFKSNREVPACRSRSQTYSSSENPRSCEMGIFIRDSTSIYPKTTIRVS